MGGGGGERGAFPKQAFRDSSFEMVVGVGWEREEGGGEKVIVLIVATDSRL